MSLSQLYETVRHRRRLRCGEGQTWQHGCKIEASVEAIRELGQVAWQVLGAHRVVGAVDRILDVAQHGIDPVERVASAGEACRIFAFTRLARPSMLIAPCTLVFVVCTGSNW